MNTTKKEKYPLCSPSQKRAAKAAISDLLKEFDFERAHALLVLGDNPLHDPKTGEPYYPSIAMMKQNARRLLEEVVELHYSEPNRYGTIAFSGLHAECLGDGSLWLSVELCETMNWVED